MKLIKQFKLPIWFFILFFLLSCQEKTEVILFTSNRNGNSDIFLMGVEGNNVVQLTNDSTEEWAPVWLNEREISFLRQTGDQVSRHEMNIFTRKEKAAAQPENCSLVDKNVLYSVLEERIYPCDSNIYHFNPISNQYTNLTAAMKGLSSYPAWTKDGRYVVFTNDRSGDNDVYLMEVKSLTARRLTNFNSNDERGELSPDGQWLVYSSDYYEKGNQDILILNINEGLIEKISDSPGTELIARWSSDGRSIFYGSDKDENWEIYRYDLDSKETKRLTDNRGFDGDPRVLSR